LSYTNNLVDTLVMDSGSGAGMTRTQLQE